MIGQNHELTIIAMDNSIYAIILVSAIKLNLELFE
jgi:hypothetical protein